MSETVTIAEIAKRAGVGKTTVSRVINNNGYVKRETREKVEKIMRDLSYFPSSIAKNLSNRKSDLIALIIPQIENAFYAEVLKGISLVLDREGYTLIVCNTNNDIKKDMRALETIYKQRAAGVIYTPVSDYKQKEDIGMFRELFFNMDIPCVLLDRLLDQSSMEVNAVVSDNFGSAYMAVEALIQGGSRKIGGIFTNIRHYIMYHRFRGYKKALEDYGLVVNEKYILDCDTSDSQKVYEMVKVLLESADYPEAVFCGNNITSIGFFKAAFEKKIRIPEDMAYIGYDEVPALDILGKQFSCLDRDLVGMGCQAAELLLQQIKSNTQERQTIFIPSTLNLKGSEKCYR